MVGSFPGSRDATRLKKVVMGLLLQDTCSQCAVNQKRPSYLLIKIFKSGYNSTKIFNLVILELRPLCSNKYLVGLLQLSSE